MSERHQLINKVIQEIKDKKISVRAAAKKYAIPKSTLSDHLTGKYKGPHGKQPVFSELEERIFSDHAGKVAEWGFPFTRLDLRLVVKIYLDKQGRNVPIFKNNLPGEEWVNGFFNRNPDLRLRMSRNITHRRAKVGHDEVSQYFENLKESLENIPPTNILNYDETNLSDDPGSSKCIFKRGTKYPERILNSSKSCISMMFAGTASGHLLPPYVCYKAERLYDAWVAGGPPGARYNRSKSGWIDEETFADWFKTVALPWAKSLEGKKVVIGDNLSTHFSADVLKMCEQHDIRFVCLPPNATHLLQPLDVAFFRPLKGAWRQILCDWKVTADRRLSNLPKNQFPSLLAKLCETISANQAKNLQAGFRACGIYPLDPKHVLDKFAKRMENHVMESPSKQPRKLVGEAVIQFLSDLRHSPGQTKPMRKKKLNVSPGASISATDIQNHNSKPSTSAGEPVKNKVAKKRLRVDSSSSSDDHFSVKDFSDDLNFSDPDEPQPLGAGIDGVFKDPAVGDWLLVKFPGKREIKYYVGVVEEVVPEGLGIKFARNINKTSLFKWPEPADKCIVDYDQVERNIGVPSFNYKNDRLVSFKFSCSFDGFTIQ